VPVVEPEDVLGRPSGRGRQAFHGGQLDGLVLGHVTGGPVADDDLQRRRNAGHAHRDGERGALVAAAPAAQQRPRVAAREDEPGHDEGGEVHVDVLTPEHRVGEQRLPRVHVSGPAIDQGEPAGMVHPGIDRDNEKGARHSSDGDRDAGQEVRARAEPVPAVGVDPDEDGLGEEREALQREAEPEDVPEVLGPHRPQQAQLEGQDRAGDHAHREQREHDLRPAPRQRPVQGVAGAQVAVLGEQHEHRERNAERYEGDVHGERERLQLPCLEQIVLVHVHIDTSLSRSYYAM
jgi:hypothetical protein